MHYGNIFLRGQGFSPNGQFPFIDKVNTKTFKKTRFTNLAILIKLKVLLTMIQKISLP